MAPTHVTKRQAAPRAAAPKKAAARKGAPDVMIEEPTAVEAAPGLLVVPEEVGAATAEAVVTVDAPAPIEEVPAAPAEAAPVPRASRLQALATGQATQAVSEAPAAPAHTVKADGRHEVWADGEGTVTVLVIADLFKAHIDGSPRYGYRGNLLTVPAATAERGIRYGALTKEV